MPIPVRKGKDAEADGSKPYNYFTHRMKRSVSGASMEARNGTAVSFSYDGISWYLLSAPAAKYRCRFTKRLHAERNSATATTIEGHPESDA
jgi:hypothetical protein